MPMPYMLAKGPIMSVLETIANGGSPQGLATLQQSLDGLRGGARITTLAGLDSQNLATPYSPIYRVERYWFGRSQVDNGYVDQPAFDPADPQPTGYWRGYYGDVESIMRETIIRAIEVSLGIDTTQNVADRTRQWPIEVFWACPHPWVEGWVTWRCDPNNKADGQVTAIFATPADTVNQITTRPLEPADPPTPLTQGVSPGTEAQGMWLISQSDHISHTVYRQVDIPNGSAVDRILDSLAFLIGMPSQVWTVPSPTTLRQGDGPVVTVELPPEHGGPIPGGMPYVP